MKTRFWGVLKFRLSKNYLKWCWSFLSSSKLFRAWRASRSITTKPTSKTASLKTANHYTTKTSTQQVNSEQFLSVSKKIWPHFKFGQETIRLHPAAIIVKTCIKYTEASDKFRKHGVITSNFCCVCVWVKPFFYKYLCKNTCRAQRWF